MLKNRQKKDTAQASHTTQPTQASASTTTPRIRAPLDQNQGKGDKTPAKSVSLADTIAPPSTNDMAQVAQAMQVLQGMIGRMMNN